MSAMESTARIRTEQDILERLDNVRRLIEMETTLLTAEGAQTWCRYCLTDRDGKRIGSSTDDLLHGLRDTIQLQLLSIVALCYGSNPDVGEPAPMLEWAQGGEGSAEDVFRETWDKCLIWNG